MNVTASLDRLHARIVRSVILQKFADFMRVILSVGFFAPGLNKLMGIPFSFLPLDNPVGAFFHALFQTGFYYRFIGAAQVLAAVLVLFRRTSTLGALLFFSITFNVFIITVSVDFGTGTPIVTGLMLLASLYLVCWDYDKLKPLLPLPVSDEANRKNAPSAVEHPRSLASSIGYWSFAVAGSLFMCDARGLMPRGVEIQLVALAASLLTGMIMTSGFAFDVVRRWRTSLAERAVVSR